MKNVLMVTIIIIIVLMPLPRIHRLMFNYPANVTLSKYYQHNSGYIILYTIYSSGSQPFFIRVPPTQFNNFHVSLDRQNLSLFFGLCMRYLTCRMELYFIL